MELEFSRNIFEKHQISRKSIQWESSSSMRADGWTDRHDEADGSFPQFRECAYKFYILPTQYISVFFYWAAIISLHNTNWLVFSRVRKIPRRVC